MPSEKARIRKVIEALKGYTPNGKKVTFGFHGVDYAGVIVRQGGVGPGAVFFVKLDKPVGFEDHVKRLHLGEKESKALYEQMIADNCLDTDGRINCLWAYWRDLTVEPKRGILLEYTEDDPKNVMSITNYPGRVVGVDGDIILLEVFEPIPFMRVPEAVASEHIKKGFYADVVVSLGLDTANAWKKKDPAGFPPGAWTEDGFEYILKEPIPLKDFHKFCERFFPNEPGCAWQGLLMYIIPIDTRERGDFRPMREDLADYFAGEYEVAYENQ